MSGQPFRVLVTGSRTWTDRAAVWRSLADLFTEAVLAGGADCLVVVHGDARQGADRLAREWVEQLWPEGEPVIQEPHPVTGEDYSTNGAIAPILRNREMVAAGADLCLTFIALCPCPKRQQPHGTHGSVHCATAAAEAGIPVRHISGRHTGA